VLQARTFSSFPSQFLVNDPYIIVTGRPIIALLLVEENTKKVRYWLSFNMNERIKAVRMIPAATNAFFRHKAAITRVTAAFHFEYASHSTSWGHKNKHSIWISQFTVSQKALKMYLVKLLLANLA
jgi:hypothetical protein